MSRATSKGSQSKPGLRSVGPRAAAQIGTAAALALALLWTAFPIYWMIVTAIRPDTDVFRVPLTLWPRHITVENFGKLMSPSVPMGRFFWNSVVTSIMTAIFTLGAVLPAGYAFSRCEFRLKEFLFLIILLVQLLPLILLIVPMYALFLKLQLLNTPVALVLAFMSFTVPFAVWLTRGFIDAVPREIEEAALIDGASRIMALRLVVLPILKAAMTAVASFAFLDAWNSLLIPLVLTTDINMKTLSPGILYAFSGQFRDDWGGLMAASLVTSAPVVAMFLALQRYMRQGIEGAVKA